MCEGRIQPKDRELVGIRWWRASLGTPPPDQTTIVNSCAAAIRARRSKLPGILGVVLVFAACSLARRVTERRAPCP